jgi:hypothetical protein
VSSLGDGGGCVDKNRRRQEWLLLKRNRYTVFEVRRLSRPLLCVLGKQVVSKKKPPTANRIYVLNANSSDISIAALSIDIIMIYIIYVLKLAQRTSRRKSPDSPPGRRTHGTGSSVYILRIKYRYELVRNVTD